MRADQVVFTGRFPAVAASVRQARRLLRMLPPDVPPELFARLEIIVSELTTNAVVHARTPFEVSVRLRPTVRVEVSDSNPAVPVLRHPELPDGGGRGLVVVASCTQEWGYSVTRSGAKTVWADLGVAWGVTKS